MPAPPPNGASSTLRCRSAAAERRSCTRTSSKPAARARPITEMEAMESTGSGKMVKMSILNLVGIGLIGLGPVIRSRSC